MRPFLDPEDLGDTAGESSGQMRIVAACWRPSRMASGFSTSHETVLLLLRDPKPVPDETPGRSTHPAGGLGPSLLLRVVGPVGLWDRIEHADKSAGQIQ